MAALLDALLSNVRTTPQKVSGKANRRHYDIRIAPQSRTKADREGSEEYPNPDRDEIPEDFRPLLDEAEILANSVEKGLGMIKKAIADENREDLIRGLDALIENINQSVQSIQNQLEPETYKALERAQNKARELGDKASKPGLSSVRREQYESMSGEWTYQAEYGVEVIKEMQDTRVALMKRLSDLEDEKELIIAELEIKQFPEAILSLNDVIDNLENVHLSIRGMVGAPRMVASPPNE